MQTSTYVYRQLRAAEFSEPQAKALLEILQKAGIVEPDPPESELEGTEQYLSAEPFEPFVIEMKAGGVTESNWLASADLRETARSSYAASTEQNGPC